jgi:hypothetical protein
LTSASLHRLLALSLSALALAACGESAQGKAKAQVCPIGCS